MHPSVLESSGDRSRNHWNKSIPMPPATTSYCSSPEAINSDADTALSLSISLFGLPVCWFFLASTWRRWVASHRRSRSTAQSPVLSSLPPGTTANAHLKLDGTAAEVAKRSSSIQKLSFGVPSHSAGHQSIDRPVPAAEPSRSRQVSTVVSETVKFWTHRFFHPQGLNQLLSNLLLCSWSILTYDQVCHIFFITTITFACPQYNCHTHISFATPGCAAGLFEGLQLIVQPFGVCFFAIASINRFINVYSRLSRNRYIALHVGTLLICLVCTGLSAATIFTYTITSSSMDLTGSQVARAQEMLVLADFVAYLVIGSVCTLALIMGLQYIIQIRKEVSALQPAIATPSVFQASENAVFAATGSSAATGLPATGLANASSPSLLLIGSINSPCCSALQTLGVNRPPQGQVGGSPSLPPSSSSESRPRFSFNGGRNREPKRGNSMTTVVCILLNISIMVVFPIMHPYVNKSNAQAVERGTSALFDSAFMLICQKIFAGTVTVAINQMTALVLAKDSSM